jgi:hypothetical protein
MGPAWGTLTAADIGAGTFPSGGFAFQGAVNGITTLAVSGVSQFGDALQLTAAFTATPVPGSLYRDANRGVIIFGVAGGTADFAILNSTGASALTLATGTKNFTIVGSLTVGLGGVTTTTLAVSGNSGFNGTAPIAKPTVTGSRGANAALASLLTALANYGLVVDSSS